MNDLIKNNLDVTKCLGIGTWDNCEYDGTGKDGVFREIKFDTVRSGPNRCFKKIPDTIYGCLFENKSCASFIPSLMEKGIQKIPRRYRCLLTDEKCREEGVNAKHTSENLIKDAEDEKIVYNLNELRGYIAKKIKKIKKFGDLGDCFLRGGDKKNCQNFVQSSIKNVLTTNATALKVERISFLVLTVGTSVAFFLVFGYLLYDISQIY